MNVQRQNLHPDLIPAYDEFLRSCSTDPWLVKNGITILTTCTFRSMQEQQACWDQGRTKPGPVCMCGGKNNPIGTCVKHPLGLCVTWALPGQSLHNFMLHGFAASKAFDVVPLRYGKPIWGTSGNGIDIDPSDDMTDDLEAWQRVGAIGKSLGLSWAGDWPKGKTEFPHFQMDD